MSPRPYFSPRFLQCEAHSVGQPQGEDKQDSSAQWQVVQSLFAIDIDRHGPYSIEIDC